MKGQWGEVNLRRILEFVGLIAYCDFDEQVHVGPDRELSRCVAGQ
ncbi:rmuC family protein [Synechococcus sp. ROS8604]|nr:rmuC family protein [Synechococcus sp. ROS8604]